MANKEHFDKDKNKNKNKKPFGVLEKFIVKPDYKNNNEEITTMYPVEEIKKEKK